MDSDVKLVGRKNANRVWGLMSKFVMLDRFMKTFGVAEIHAGFNVPRDTSLLQCLGTADKVSIFLPNYMTLMALSDPRRAQSAHESN